MAKKSLGNDYLGLPWIVSLILTIIPITNLVLGVITRFCEGHWICALIRLLFGWNIIWILDIGFMSIRHKIFRIN